MYKLFGCLPASGGFSDQSNLVIEAIIYCQGLINTVQQDVKYKIWDRRQRKKEEDEFNQGLGSEKTIESIRERREKRNGNSNKNR